MRGLRSAQHSCTLCLLAALSVGGCGSPDVAAPDQALESLRERVAALRTTVDAQLDPEVMFAGETLSSADVVVKLRVGMLQELLNLASSHYLDDVQLHLRPGTVARENNEVKTRIGPIRINAGRWALHVSIDDIQATLRAREPTVRVDGDDRFALFLPAYVENGHGSARIQFSWDAAAVTSLVCRDFEVDESFSAIVSAREYRLLGHFLISPVEGGLVLDPEFPQRLDVQPQPTEESWAHIREILQSQDKMFRCGLALNATNMEAKLRETLQKGFRFRLPDSVLRPIALPSSISKTVELRGHDIGVAATPAGLRLTHEWLWYGIAVELTHEDEGEGEHAHPAASQS